MRRDLEHERLAMLLKQQKIEEFFEWLSGRYLRNGNPQPVQAELNTILSRYKNQFNLMGY